MYPAQETHWGFLIWPPEIVSIVDGSHCRYQGESMISAVRCAKNALTTIKPLAFGIISCLQLFQICMHVKVCKNPLYQCNNNHCSWRGIFVHDCKWYWFVCCPLQWHHNGRDGVSNHQPYWIVYSGADQIKHQSLVSLASVWGIHRWIPCTNGQFPFDDVIILWIKQPFPLKF